MVLGLVNTLDENLRCKKAFDLRNQKFLQNLFITKAQLRRSVVKVISIVNIVKDKTPSLADKWREVYSYVPFPIPPGLLGCYPSIGLF